MTTDALREARQTWAHAQMDLDTYLTRFIPVALAADAEGGEELERMLRPEQSAEIARLYGETISLWTKYLALMRKHDADGHAAPDGGSA